MTFSVKNTYGDEVHDAIFYDARTRFAFRCVGIPGTYLSLASP